MEDEKLQEFLAESWENLSRLDTEIVALEKDLSNAELLASIFHTIHTIKGTCGFIGLTRLGAVGHSAENVLGKMRDGALEVSSAAISLVLEAVDSIRELLEGLDATGEEPNRDDSQLIAKLDLLADLADLPPEPAASPIVQAPISDENSEQPPTGDEHPAAAADVAATTETANEPAPPQQPEDSPVSTQVEERTSAPDLADNTGNASASETNVKAAGKKSVADLSIRVNVDVLDSLMNLVGELVLTRNQLLQMARGDEESKYSAPITHLKRVTTDLQEGVMKTRMQPIGNAWNKLPRLVRDLSQTTGRLIELEMSGAETEAGASWAAACWRRKPPQPEILYWIAMPIRLDATQYKTRPAGTWKLINTNMAGNIQSIIFWLCCWRGSAFGIIIIFCWAHMEPAERSGNRKRAGPARLPVKTARSMPRKPLSMGMASWTTPSPE